MLCEEQTNVWNSICLNPSINRFVNCLALVTLICQIADLSWCINVYCVCQLFVSCLICLSGVICILLDTLLEASIMSQS